jgi:hypothetical protein
LSSSRKSLHGLQAFECDSQFLSEELAGKQKGTAENDSALLGARLSAALTAAAYEEEGARIRGLDGAYLRHSLSRLPRRTPRASG